MPKVVARNASIGIDDSTGACQAVSSKSSNATLSWTAEAIESTGFGDNTRQRLSDTIKDVEFRFDAFFDTGATGLDAILAGILGGSTRFVFGPTGSTSGCVLYSSCVVCTNYELTFGVADAANVSATFSNRSGSLTRTTFG